MKSSAQKLVTLVVISVLVISVLITNIITLVVGAPNGEEASPEATVSCLGPTASENYKAHKEHVIQELADVTPTVDGYQYSTTFPSEGSTDDVINGYAGCTANLEASDCSECLGDARDALMGGDCAYAVVGTVQTLDCNMYYVPAKKV